MSTTIPRGLDESPDRSDSAGVAQRARHMVGWLSRGVRDRSGSPVVMRGVVWLRLAGRPARPRVFATVVSLICGDWLPQDLDFVARSAV